MYANARPLRQLIYWWIARNPTYLLSAALMALGARLYLDHPNARAGDAGLILLTLGVLQGYEWAVATILVVLHHMARSPEDKPSLMLVTALFWTGPLAATSEMIAHRADLGLLLSGGACAIAIIEFSFLRRTLGLRISPAGRLTAALAVLFLGIAPTLIKIPETANGTNELFLYFSWWLLAALALIPLASVRWHGHGRKSGAWLGRSRRDLYMELSLTAIVLAAAAAHLAAMNYAYYGHARWFYVSPLLCAVGMTGIGCLVQLRTRWPIIAGFFASLPLIAIVPTGQGFDARVPVEMLPVWLQDPALAVLVLAGTTWWYAARRLGSKLLLHMGTAAMAGGVFLARDLLVPPVAAPMIATAAPQMAWIQPWFLLILATAAGYFALLAVVHRSRSEGVLAVLLLQAAWLVGMAHRGEQADLLAVFSFGWCALLIVHIVGRPKLGHIALPVIYLLTVSWFFDGQTQTEWLARVHGSGLVVAMLILGQFWPATHYRGLAVAAACGHMLFYGGRNLTRTDHLLAASVVIASFALLAAGAAISFYKPTLLRVPTGNVHHKPLSSGLYE